MGRFLADFILKTAARLYAGDRIRFSKGGADLPDSPVIFAPNHPTTLDPVLLRLAIPRPYSALITDSAFSLPFVSSTLKAGGHLPVGERGTGGRRLIEDAARRLKEGRSIAVFPCGCLDPPSGMASLRSGTVRIAALSRASVVPVGIAVCPINIMEINTRINGRIERGRYLLKGLYVIRFGSSLRFDLDPEDRPAVLEATSRLAESLASVRHEAKLFLGDFNPGDKTMEEDVVPWSPSWKLPEEVARGDRFSV